MNIGLNGTKIQKLKSLDRMNINIPFQSNKDIYNIESLALSHQSMTKKTSPVNEILE